VRAEIEEVFVVRKKVLDKKFRIGITFFMKSHFIVMCSLFFFSSGNAAPWGKEKEENTGSVSAAEHRDLEASVVSRVDAITQFANESFELLASVPFERYPNGVPYSKSYTPETLDRVAESLMRSQIEVMALKEFVSSQLQLREAKGRKRQGARPDGMYNRAHLRSLKIDDIIDDSELSDL
jgi:hypothetical protein